MKGTARILFAANTSWYLYNHRRDTLLAFLEAGWEVHTLSPRDVYSERLAALGCRVSHLPLSPASKNPLLEIRSILAFVAAYCRIHPRLAFHFTIKCNLYGGFAAGLLGIPFINNIAGLGSAFEWHGLPRRLTLGTYRFTQRRAGRVIFQSPEDLAYMVKTQLVAATRALLVPGSGVDLQRFVPMHPRAPDGKIVFVYVGRLLREKGLAELAEAMRHVRVEHPEAVCRVYGFPEEGNARFVQHAELEAWERERLLEYRGPLDDVRSAYAGADCVVLPTYYREGIPKNLVEASAMAKPIVTTSLSGCRVVVRDGENGFLCSPRDIGSLAKALLSVIAAGPAVREAMGRRGREIAEASFGKERVARAYLDAAETLVA